MAIPASVRDLFHPAPGLTFLDAATFGLPPQPTVGALTRALERWQAGTADWVAEWDLEAETCRSLFAQLVSVSPTTIALVPTVSTGVGMIATGLRPGTEVLLPENEFTSVLFPIRVAAERGDVRIRLAPFDRLAEAVTSSTNLVAFSLTQSQSGKTAALADILAAADRAGAQTLVDATHAIPFVPVREHMAGIDYLVCHGYKHLLCPRGAGFFYVREDRWGEVPPYLANWRAGSPRYERSYGPEFALAPDAARFDVSLAWHAWAGARPSLELLVEWDRLGYLVEVRLLADRLAAGLDLPRPTSTLVCLTVPDAEAAEAALTRAGVRGAARGGNIRFSPHVYNTEADIDRAIEAIASLHAEAGPAHR